MKKSIIEKVCQLLKDQKPILQSFSGEDNMLVIEKSLPYICLYRYHSNPDPHIKKIIKTQASYLLCNGDEDIKELLTCISQTISTLMNTFMLLEIWPGNGNSKTFKVYCPENKAPATIDAFTEGLNTFEQHHDTRVKVIGDEIAHPPKLEPLFDLDEAVNIGCLPVGLEIPPVYREQASGSVYPIYFRGFKSYLSDIIKKAAFEFIRVQTSHHFNHHLMFGKTSISEAAQKVDQCFAELSEKIDFLLRVTPVNQQQEWERFKKNKFKEPPHFNYRMITLDPEKEKRNIYNVPMDEIEDPALSFIFRDKRRELEKKLSMLEERETLNFRYIGQSIYGVPDEALVKAANNILKNVKASRTPSSEMIDCMAFSSRAKKEIKYYQDHFPEQKITVEIRKDITGLVVSKSNLMIGESTSVGKNRAAALIQHEVGTHILTYCNGSRQPLRQMASGLAGYDELQEGLAVLSEYLMGGLDNNRLRLLAARVLAVDCMVKEADFIETFNLLAEKCGLKQYSAFKVTARVFRGGGLTKDAVYMKGLLGVLEYLKEGGNPELLFSGKFNLNHIPLIEELIHRDVLKSPVLPNHYEEKGFKERLNKLNTVTQPIELLN